MLLKWTHNCSNFQNRKEKEKRKKKKWLVFIFIDIISSQTLGDNQGSTTSLGEESADLHTHNETTPSDTAMGTWRHGETEAKEGDRQKRKKEERTLLLSQATMFPKETLSQRQYVGSLGSMGRGSAARSSSSNERGSSLLEKKKKKEKKGQRKNCSIKLRARGSKCLPITVSSSF